MDYRRNRIYFYPIPEKSVAGGIVCIVLGIIIALLLRDGCAGGVYFGIGIAIVGAILAGYAVNFNKTRVVVTDNEIDQVCAGQLQRIAAMALRKLGIELDEVTEHEPISFYGYYFAPLVSPIVCRRGNDGRFRSSNYNVAMLFFSESQVFCCHHRFSLIADEQQTQTDEFFYSDIVSVSTASETAAYGNQSIRYDAFRLSTSGATSVYAALLDIDHAERAIHSMKSLLRKKKQQTQS